MELPKLAEYSVLVTGVDYHRVIRGNSCQVIPRIYWGLITSVSTTIIASVLVSLIETTTVGTKQEYYSLT